jgi:hypothetical protein
MSDELSKVVLGSLIMQPNFLEISELDESLFSDDRQKKIFRIISEIWENGRPKEIDPVFLAERLGGDGAVTFVGELTAALQHFSPEVFVSRVQEIKRRRLSEKILRAAECQSREYLRTGVFDEDGLAELKGLISDQEGQGAAFDPYAFMRTGSQLQALDIHVDWVVDKLVPKGAITLLHGPGGLGKTWLCLALAKAVSEGLPFLGLQTKQCEVVYVDYENPLAVDHDRTCMLNVCAPRFWHLSDPTRPPKLDGPDWHLLKSLHRGSMIIIDTARGATDGDEIKGQDVALVMNRLKEIRELGQHIVLQAHTSKANKKISKGATTWEDLADHTIAFYRVRPGTLEEIEEEGFDPNALLFLGSGNKTRYEPSRFYVSLDAINGTFSMVRDPNADAIDALAEYIAGDGYGQNQSEIFAWAKDKSIVSRKDKLLALLKRGELASRWHSRKSLRAIIYET